MKNLIHRCSVFMLISCSLSMPAEATENDFVVIDRNTTPMIFPYKEEAFVYWGGEKLEQNYHNDDVNQQYALDIIMVADGAPFKGDPQINESYFIFGKDIIAPSDAKVVKVIRGVKDNVPGVENPQQLTGNTIVSKTALNEYLMFAHLKYVLVPTLQRGNA